MTSASIFSGMAPGQRADLELAADLREQAAVGDALGLADEHERDVHLHLLVLAHVDEVRVEDLAGDADPAGSP